VCCRRERLSVVELANTRPRAAISRFSGRNPAAAAVLNITCCSVIRTSAEDGFAGGTADRVVGVAFSVASSRGSGAGELRVSSLVSMAFVS
jgi:hypothetical protein